ncbi:unnamed protein product [Rhizophagus irregularis]|nr:unnamed protein product [Rhizophagus irregularis]
MFQKIVAQKIARKICQELQVLKGHQVGIQNVMHTKPTRENEKAVTFSDEYNYPVNSYDGQNDIFSFTCQTVSYTNKTDIIPV